jgi:hypothetical protein
LVIKYKIYYAFLLSIIVYFFISFLAKYKLLSALDLQKKILANKIKSALIEQKNLEKTAFSKKQ